MGGRDWELRQILGGVWGRLPYGARRTLYRSVLPRRYAVLQGMRESTAEFGGLRPFDDLECIFVHVPKCAGISVSSSLFGRPTGTHINARMFQAVYSRREWERYFKFTVVRNPWDRMVSAYRYLRQGGSTELDRAWARENLAPSEEFGDFVRRWVTEDNVGTYMHFKPQVNFVCDDRGEVLVDYVGRYESLAEDFSYIAERLGVDTQLTHRNRSAAPTDTPYRSYYDTETAELVGRVYQRDVETFGYRFE